MNYLRNTSSFSQNWRIYLSFLFISFFYLIVHSTNTSPMFIGYGGDSSNYLMMGRMLLAGKIPYLDFFDHKGPVITFIEALGQFIAPDKLGVFIIQVVNLTFILSIVYCVARLLLDKVYSMLTVIVMLLFFTFTIEGGNLTEEYSLPFLFLTLYVALKFYVAEYKYVSSFHLFIVGFCAAFLFWLRLNNMGALCACVLFIFIVTVQEKNWQLTKKLILFFTLGFLAGTAPVVIYFFATDSFAEMIEAAFIHNLKYVGVDGGLPSPFRDPVSAFFFILKAWLPFIILFIGTFLYYIRIRKDGKILLFSALLFVFGYITTHIGSAYYHYMTLNIPAFTLGCIYIFAVFARAWRKSAVPITLCIFFGAGLVVFSVFRYAQKGGGTAGDSYYISQAKEIVADVPENERNSIFAYQTYSRFYTSAQVLPCYKYYIMQEWMGRSNEQIITDINEMMQTNSPKWVFTEFRDQSTNPRFWEIIDEKYDLYAKNNLFEAYRLKDEK